LTYSLDRPGFSTRRGQRFNWIFTRRGLESAHKQKKQATLMITLFSGGLVRPAGEVSAAANEDLVDPTFCVNTDARHGEHAGWDPYEVWRTRVKPALVTRRQKKDPDHRE
jgi:hypothetical protein